MTNQATNKLSPKKQLTENQQNLLNKIINFCNDNLNKESPSVFAIYGDAGTGKSVVLSALFDKIQLLSKQKDSNLYQTKNYFLVNHPELLKVYKQIAGDYQELLKKNYQRPTSFINTLDKTKQKADIVVIDEAHLLLSKPDHYNNFYYQNQLQEIINRSKIVILVFDPHQVLKMKTLWTNESLKAIIQKYNYQIVHLHEQFRMKAPLDLIDWFDSFTDKMQLKPIPADCCQDYDFQVFEDAEQMRQKIVEKNKQFGLSRILSTSGYPSTLDGGKHYICEGDFKMPWDQYNYTATPWAEISETIDEVGSIYTCQGFDLNYAGIIIGPPIFQRPNSSRIEVDLDKITDIEMFKKRQDLTDPVKTKKLKVQMVMNALNVLFKRGVHGTYLYAHDPILRKNLLNLYHRV
ncbi:DUF2075 domain-containing protein [Lactobacillus hominis]|uniref:Schlafen group 3-like DNA/RNA helicase domain-containing protein n=1 Tax=Lactobacillus hominis DSM 23910 = CRBIP 24.179 TaxID=1423758 RepID=I7JUU2_9LACO|nr:DUF2075 domain-containing protein [Lactobacillus hominis]KRM84456.1 hypothetical protein FC41_GL000738 [Lactobacillus hominis DSM 23910 = CRBIP 24.179]MCT3347935.1 DUF2075 domain-containing protein [Lactobacillus hominis]CCI81706.1 Putative uncharacterized protein [Lactobacillus hominis DSM 23910 = CRBIP 24.179]